MYNDFIVVGPITDPSKIEGGNEVISTFKKITDANAKFVSRGDNSRTDFKGRGYWQPPGTKSKPVLERFFAWIDEQFDKQGFLPSSPFLGALAYIRERRVGLSVYLDDPEVSLDTNHLERALRVIPMGKKNWLFSWTELGAKHIGIVQSLLATWRLHDINPYDYLVDVLQRVGQHPASLVHQLTPRVWKGMFADDPLRSGLHDISGLRTRAAA